MVTAQAAVHMKAKLLLPLASTRRVQVARLSFEARGRERTALARLLGDHPFVPQPMSGR